MARSRYSNAMNMLTGSVSKAFDGIRKAAGKETDKDLLMYNALTADDFAKLSSTFGPHQTVEYIRDMEMRKMKKGA